MEEKLIYKGIIFDLGMERLPVQHGNFWGQRKIVTVTWNSYQTGKNINKNV